MCLDVSSDGMPGLPGGRSAREVYSDRTATPIHLTHSPATSAGVVTTGLGSVAATCTMAILVGGCR